MQVSSMRNELRENEANNPLIYIKRGAGESMVGPRHGAGAELMLLCLKLANKYVKG